MGTVLAAILASASLSAGVFALLAHFSAKKPPEAKPTRKRHEAAFVTHEELEEAIDKATKELQYEWTEWYEKFDKLHLRLAKRAKRQEEQQNAPQEELEIPSGRKLGVVDLRRFGSP